MNSKNILSIMALAGVSLVNTQPIPPDDITGNNTTYNNSEFNDKSTKAKKDTTINTRVKRNNNATTYEIENNIITMSNIWEEPIGVLRFNSLTNKILFRKGWAGFNDLVDSKDTFSISLYRYNKTLIKSVFINIGEEPQSKLSLAFNNLSFFYGDILKIDYSESINVNISNFNGERDYQITKPIFVEITRDGLEELPYELTEEEIINANKVIEVSNTISRETNNEKVEENFDDTIKVYTPEGNRVNGQEYIEKNLLDILINTNVDSDKDIVSNKEEIICVNNVEVVDSETMEIILKLSATGKKGEETGLKEPEIPSGYHLMDITNLRGEIVSRVPEKFSVENEIITYYVVKDIIHKVHMEIKNDQGEIILAKHEVASGSPGSYINIHIPKILDNYYISKILINGIEANKDINGEYILPNRLSDNSFTEINENIEIIISEI